MAIGKDQFPLNFDLCSRCSSLHFDSCFDGFFVLIRDIPISLVIMYTYKPSIITTLQLHTLMLNSAKIIIISIASILYVTLSDLCTVYQHLVLSFCTSSHKHDVEVCLSSSSKVHILHIWQGCTPRPALSPGKMAAPAPKGPRV